MLLERRKRAESALISVVVTCYLLGVSTRRMDKLVATPGITSLSKSQVSRMAAELDEPETGWWDEHGDLAPWPDDIDEWRPLAVAHAVLIGDPVHDAGSARELDHLLAVPAAQRIIEVEHDLGLVVLRRILDEDLEARGSALLLSTGPPAS